MLYLFTLFTTICTTDVLVYNIVLLICIIYYLYIYFILLLMYTSLLCLYNSAITPKTKILLLNTPHNPTGKVFSYRELVQIAEIVKENPQITVISDEVYKFSVYNPVELGDSFAKGHFHFARLEGMWERTITISSCGKTFSVTGWQVGWMVAPTKYTLPIQDIIPCIQFCASTPIQAALSYAISQATQPYEGFDTYYEWLRCQFSSKRIVLEAGLKSVGIEPLQSRGGFFLLAKLPDVPILSKYDKYDELYDWKYCRMLAHECGIVGIPASSFFSPTSQHGSKDHMARFAFCKKDETMTLATEKCYKYAITTATTNTLLSATNKSIIVL